MLTYAEIHYRPFRVPSLIYVKQPEIICDAPTRVDPGQPVPVFIFIKDAHLFPVNIEAVLIHIFYECGENRVARFPYYSCPVNVPLWWDSINFVPEFTGITRIIPYVLLRRRKKIFSVCVDNYRRTKHSPLVVNVSETPLPNAENWYCGDIHCHTFYTSDQIEFGAPAEAMAFAGRSMGLDWMAVTDHSYDLDGSEDCSEKNEFSTTKWNLMRNTADLLDDTLIIIPGEEVTCATKNGRNCHMLALNSERFIEGSGDGGRNGLKTKTELPISEASSQCLQYGGISCAAHPMKKISLLEKIFLNRGEWSSDDIITPGVCAVQIHNGVRDSGFRNGKKAWIRLLLKGYRIHAFGGSDAHGDMNCRRRVGVPFLSVNETREHTFGCVWTIVRSRSKERKALFGGLKTGHTMVSEGPFIDLNVYSHDIVSGPGDIHAGGVRKISVVFKSSPEFGQLKMGRIYAGRKGETEERVVGSVDEFTSDYRGSFECTQDMKEIHYIRAECETTLDRICFTNPVWIE